MNKPQYLGEGGCRGGERKLRVFTPSYVKWPSLHRLQWEGVSFSTNHCRLNRRIVPEIWADNKVVLTTWRPNPPVANEDGCICPRYEHKSVVSVMTWRFQFWLQHMQPKKLRRIQSNQTKTPAGLLYGFTDSIYNTLPNKTSGKHWSFLTRNYCDQISMK